MLSAQELLLRMPLRDHDCAFCGTGCIVHGVGTHIEPQLTVGPAIACFQQREELRRTANTYVHANSFEEE